MHSHCLEKVHDHSKTRRFQLHRHLLLLKFEQAPATSAINHKSFTKQSQKSEKRSNVKASTKGKFFPSARNQVNMDKGKHEQGKEKVH